MPVPSTAHLCTFQSRRDQWKLICAGVSHLCVGEREQLVRMQHVWTVRDEGILFVKVAKEGGVMIE